MKVVIAMAVMAMCMGAATAKDVDDALLDALSAKESHGQSGAVGDRHLVYRAHGEFQIRKPYLDDVMRFVGGRETKATWGKARLTMADMQDEDKARWVVRKYLTHYGKVYLCRTGKEPTDETYARIHNGGPFGWKTSATDGYWADVRRNLRDVRYQVAMSDLDIQEERMHRFLDDWKLETEIGED